jgi:hypothetical protein
VMALYPGWAPHFDAWKASDWSAAAAILPATIALAAAIVAYIQVREARRTRDAQAQPFVVVDVQPSVVWANILNLVIENVGRTMAKDVRVRFSPAIATSLNGYDLANSTLIRDGIPSLPPRRRVEVLFDVSHQRIAAKLPMRYSVDVDFTDWRGRAQESLPYTVDIGYLFGLQHVEEYGMHHAAKALREMAKSMEAWTHSGRLRVATHDEDEEHRQERIEHDLTGDYPSLGRAEPSELLMAAGQNVLVRTMIRRARQLLNRRRTRP